MKEHVTFSPIRGLVDPVLGETMVGQRKVGTLVGKSQTNKSAPQQGRTLDFHTESHVTEDC
jgi:hypothetical protein